MMFDIRRVSKMIEKGEIIKLEDDKEYICIDNIENDATNYIYLVSNFKPLEIRFAKQINNNEEIEIINNNEEKHKVLDLFQKKNN